MLALIAIGVFVSALLIEACDTLNVLAVSQGRPLAAAAASVGMYALGLIGFWAFIEVSWWMAVPEVIGLALGSYVTVERSRHKVRHR